MGFYPSDSLRGTAKYFNRHHFDYHIANFKEQLSLFISEAQLNSFSKTMLELVIISVSEDG